VSERIDRTGGELRLVGSRCPGCDHPTIPLRLVCPACGLRPMDRTRFGPSGTVERHTDLEVGFAGIEAPYSIALVRLDEGPVVLSRTEGAVEPGTRVTLDADEGGDVYWFAPVPVEAGTGRGHHVG